jgi:hypothetical protein
MGPLHGLPDDQEHQHTSSNLKKVVYGPRRDDAERRPASRQTDYAQCIRDFATSWRSWVEQEAWQRKNLKGDVQRNEGSDRERSAIPSCWERPAEWRMRPQKRSQTDEREGNTSLGGLNAAMGCDCVTDRKN